MTCMFDLHSVFSKIKRLHEPFTMEQQPFYEDYEQLCPPQGTTDSGLHYERLERLY